MGYGIHKRLSERSVNRKEREEVSLSMLKRCSLCKLMLEYSKVQSKNILRSVRRAITQLQ